MEALILVDIQNDFLPGGALPVPCGDEVIPIANNIQKHFELVIATQDWHPSNHGSFAANHTGKKPGDFIMLDGIDQVLWPVHCVEETYGADFAPGLNTDHITNVFKKGTDPAIDSYSGFYDNGHRKSTGLGDFLKNMNVSDIYIMGLATDYCVKFSAFDALKIGFKTCVIEDGCRGIDLSPGDIKNAFFEIKKAGGTIIKSSSFDR
ncbi:MAG: bifunctional nicotinamidase/pyrazinamidase [Candidatus Latescibacteria bacterium]|nr:bifunctional nicotinamidase/pyrazinamidase [Candidatus Latescibacterota bacterium]